MTPWAGAGRGIYTIMLDLNMATNQRTTYIEVPSLNLGPTLTAVCKYSWDVRPIFTAAHGSDRQTEHKTEFKIIHESVQILRACVA